MRTKQSASLPIQPNRERMYAGYCPDNQCEEHEGTQNTTPTCPVCDRKIIVYDIREVVAE